MFERIVSSRITYTLADSLVLIGLSLLAGIVAYWLCGTFVAARAAAETVFMADFFAFMVGLKRSWSSRFLITMHWAHVWARTTLGGRLLTLALCIAWGVWVSPTEIVGIVVAIGVLAWSLIFLTFDVRTRRVRTV